MKIGARVVVVALWSSFKGMSGVVTQTKPYLMVRLDGDTHPMRIEEPTVVEESNPVSMTGAE